MSDRITFFVPGTPAPGGSKKAFHNPKTGNIVITDDAKGNRPWRSKVADFGHKAMAGRPPMSGPLEVAMRFVVARPRGHFGTGRNAGKVKRSSRPYPTVTPDVLKLARSTEDALTSVCWLDDCLTVRLVLAKEYGDTPGVHVTVTPMEEP